jgi:hypothetical protein
MNPEQMVSIEDTLRPQSTFDFKKQYSDQPYDFPNLYITAGFPIMKWDPISTYADDQNLRFKMRYLEKNPPSK